MNATDDMEVESRRGGLANREEMSIAAAVPRRISPDSTVFQRFNLRPPPLFRHAGAGAAFRPRRQAARHLPHPPLQPLHIKALGGRTRYGAVRALRNQRVSLDPGRPHHARRGRRGSWRRRSAWTTSCRARSAGWSAKCSSDACRRHARRAAAHPRAVSRALPQGAVVLQEGAPTTTINAVREGGVDVGLVWGNIAEPPHGIQPILRENSLLHVPAGHRLSGTEGAATLDMQARRAADPAAAQGAALPLRHIAIASAFANRGSAPQRMARMAMILPQLGFVASSFGNAISPAFAGCFITDWAGDDPRSRRGMPSVILSRWCGTTRSSRRQVELFRQVGQGELQRQSQGNPRRLRRGPVR